VIITFFSITHLSYNRNSIKSYGDCRILEESYEKILSTSVEDIPQGSQLIFVTKNCIVYDNTMEEIDKKNYVATHSKKDFVVYDGENSFLDQMEETDNDMILNQNIIKTGEDSYNIHLEKHNVFYLFSIIEKGSPVTYIYKLHSMDLDYDLNAEKIYARSLKKIILNTDKKLIEYENFDKPKKINLDSLNSFIYHDNWFATTNELKFEKRFWKIKKVIVTLDNPAFADGINSLKITINDRVIKKELNRGKNQFEFDVNYEKKYL
jgi:hypothetical protein